MMSETNRVILLLGGSGYIGTHIMLALHGQDSHVALGCRYQIVIIDIKTPSPDALRLAEKQAGGLPVIFIPFDLTQHVNYPKLIQKPHCGIMLAALKNVNEGEQIPHEYIRTNITLCVNSMELLKKLGVTRIIQASSAAIYHTDSDSDEPLGIYGYTKRVTEDICTRLLQISEEAKLLVLRYMNPIGSHREVDAFSEIGICQKLVSLKPEELFVNRGNCVRDYIHVTDLAVFHLDALEAWDATLFRGEHAVVLDVGLGVRVKTAELLEAFGFPSSRVIQAEKSDHEGYDTVEVMGSDEFSRIPQWQLRTKQDLKSSLADYRRTVKLL